MRLTAIRAKNYRSFPQAELMLRPLTLLYGENNSGKSALLRLLPLLLDSLKAGIPHGLDLTSEPLAKATLADLRTRHTAEAGPAGDISAPTALEVGFTLDTTPPLSADYTFDGVGHITRLVVKAADTTLRARWSPTDDEGDLYLISDPHAELALRFEGLCPSFDEATAPPLLKQLRAACLALRHKSGGYRWISARRPSMQRKFTLPAPTRTSFLEDVPFALQRDAALRGRVSAWYEGSFARRLEPRFEDTAKTEFSLQLAPLQTTDSINMADSGEGLSQVLPIVTAMAMLHITGAPARLTMEEPESNLHADKHEPLFLLFTAHAAAHPDHTILIETHSRPALLTILIQVASGDLKPDDVALHWIAAHTDRSVVKLAELTPDGFVEGWPHRAFEAEPELSHRLIIAQEGHEP